MFLVPEVLHQELLQCPVNQAGPWQIQRRFSEVIRISLNKVSEPELLNSIVPQAASERAVEKIPHRCLELVPLALSEPVSCSPLLWQFRAVVSLRCAVQEEDKSNFNSKRAWVPRKRFHGRMLWRTDNTCLQENGKKRYRKRNKSGGGDKCGVGGWELCRSMGLAKWLRMRCFFIFRVSEGDV